MTHKQLVTRQQYLEALEVVDKYHRQTFNNDLMNSGKVTIIDWLHTLEESPSARLYHILRSFKYLQDVNKNEFLKVRNAGVKSWLEFCELADIKTH